MKMSTMTLPKTRQRHKYALLCEQTDASVVAAQQWQHKKQQEPLSLRQVSPWGSTDKLQHLLTTIMVMIGQYSS